MNVLWYREAKQSNLDWFGNAISSLKANKWKPCEPLSLDGLCWPVEILDRVVTSLLTVLSENTSARTLILRNLSLDLKGQRALTEVFQRNHRLRSVSLCNVRLGSEKMEPPSSLLRMTRLHELVLEKIRFSRQTCLELGNLIRHSTSIRALSLIDMTSQDDSAISILATSFQQNKSLKMLLLDGLKTGDRQTLQGLIASIADNTSLTELRLENLQIGHWEERVISDLLANNRNLRELSLRKNDLDGQVMKSIVTRGLLCNTTLEAIYLSYNPLGDDGARSMIEAFTFCSSLRRVCLSNCEIWQKGCMAICEALPSFPHLLWLNLDANEVELCASELLIGVQKNLVIEEVTSKLPFLMESDTNKPAEDHQTWREIDFYLRLNKANRRVAAGANISRSNAVSVLARAADLDVLYFLIRHMPGLLKAVAC